MARFSPPVRTVQHGGTNHPASANPVTFFQYNGRTALTARGPISGTVYRFMGPGRRVVVDLRDRQSLAAIPHLAEVGSL